MKRDPSAQHRQSNADAGPSECDAPRSEASAGHRLQGSADHLQSAAESVPSRRLAFLAVRAGLVDKPDGIVPAVFVQVRAVADADRIGARPAPEPRYVISRAVVIETTLFVALLRRIAIPLRRLHEIAHPLE